MKPRESLFRAWLIDRVSEAKIDNHISKKLEDRARYLGVQPDVLEEADRRRQERIEETGRGIDRRHVHTTNYDSYTRKLSLFVPPVVLGPIEAACAARNLNFNAFARAVVQTLLVGPTNPHWMGQGWFLGDRRYGDERKLQRQFIVSRGADIALSRRADRLGVTKSGLIRGALIDAIEGHTKKLVYVDTISMWNDPDRYWTGEFEQRHPGGTTKP